MMQGMMQMMQGMQTMMRTMHQPPPSDQKPAAQAPTMADGPMMRLGAAAADPASMQAMMRMMQDMMRMMQSHTQGGQMPRGAQ
jgi:hypothetical protein